MSAIVHDRTNQKAAIRGRGFNQQHDFDSRCTELKNYPEHM